MAAKKKVKKTTKITAKKTTKKTAKKPVKKVAKKISKKTDKKIGVVSNFFDNIGVAAIKLTATLKVGDSIKIVGGENEFTDVIKSMQIQHEKVTKAKKGDEIGIKISKKARKGYKVFLTK